YLLRAARPVSGDGDLSSQEHDSALWRSPALGEVLPADSRGGGAALPASGRLPRDLPARRSARRLSERLYRRGDGFGRSRAEFFRIVACFMITMPLCASLSAHR